MSGQRRLVVCFAVLEMDSINNTSKENLKQVNHKNTLKIFFKLLKDGVELRFDTSKWVDMPNPRTE